MKEVFNAQGAWHALSKYVTHFGPRSSFPYFIFCDISKKFDQFFLIWIIF